MKLVTCAACNRTALPEEFSHRFSIISMASVVPTVGLPFFCDLLAGDSAPARQQVAMLRTWAPEVKFPSVCWLGKPLAGPVPCSQVLFGGPASGKTTLGRHLQTLGCKWFQQCHECQVARSDSLPLDSLDLLLLAWLRRFIEVFVVCSGPSCPASFMFPLAIWHGW